MKNVAEILKSYDIVVPEDKLEDFNREFHQNYKTVAEHEKKITRLEAERDDFKVKYEAASETLKDFEGIDADGMKQKLEDYEKKVKELEETHKQELYERDFSDALNTAMEQYKFSSDYAKKSVMTEIKEAGLKLIDGKIIGLNDMVEAIKGKDASAFVDEAQQNLENGKASFTKPQSKGANGKKLTMVELMKMKNENPDMDISQYVGKGE